MPWETVQRLVGEAARELRRGVSEEGTRGSHVVSLVNAILNEALAEEAPAALGSAEAVPWSVAFPLASLLGVDEAGRAVAAAQSEVAAFPFHVTLTSAACPGGRSSGRLVWPTGQVTESHTC